MDCQAPFFAQRPSHTAKIASRIRTEFLPEDSPALIHFTPANFPEVRQESGEGLKKRNRRLVVRFAQGVLDGRLQGGFFERLGNEPVAGRSIGPFERALVPKCRDIDHGDIVLA